ncbi:hypothetical protein JTB14_037596 [Gonioctena quinquepunctata]|nr:hypothetical protein JTB14_037596 [Gonioctena quinquepunctata]
MNPHITFQKVHVPRITYFGIYSELAGTLITSNKFVKYFGVWLDDRLIFNEHIRRQCEKADRQTAAMAKILPNMRDPNTQKGSFCTGMRESRQTNGNPFDAQTRILLRQFLMQCFRTMDVTKYAEGILSLLQRGRCYCVRRPPTGQSLRHPH